MYGFWFWLYGKVGSLYCGGGSSVFFANVSFCVCLFYFAKGVGVSIQRAHNSGGVHGLFSSCSIGPQPDPTSQA